ncbi:MAG: TIGR02996 domain-containing protein [Gemmataceae bacterium]|nr:TIGR02996 domain-containing protein [Gemmata sp.]MDW8199163.1 TIGR02996 domain-containing protein [Gemmataceae bacterium]
MSVEAALRAAVLAHPEDDVARLIYADWLEEHGQASQARFIRHQIWAAQAEPHSPTARYHDAQAEALLLSHRFQWTQAIGDRINSYQFHRGFIEQVTVDVAVFPRDAAALLAVEPIQALRLYRLADTAAGDCLQHFFASPHLERIKRLDFSSMPVAPVELEGLVGSAFVANITELRLSGVAILPELLERLLLGTAMPQLVALDLSDLAHVGPRLAQVLPALRQRRFRRLDLSRIVLNSQELQQILASACLRQIEELMLGWLTGIDRAGPLTHLDLGWVIPWERLRYLDLNGQGIGDQGIREMVREWTMRAGPSPLRWLGLANNHITPEGLQMLTEVPESRLKLYCVDVRGNHLRDSAVRLLQKRFPEAMILRES